MDKYQFSKADDITDDYEFGEDDQLILSFKDFVEFCKNNDFIDDDGSACVILDGKVHCNLLPSEIINESNRYQILRDIDMIHPDMIKIEWYNK